MTLITNLLFSLYHLWDGLTLKWNLFVHKHIHNRMTLWRIKK